MRRQGRTGVVLHTFETADPHWYSAMWGIPAEPGRIPTAVATALETEAELLLVFTCISPLNGQNTGAAIRDLLFARIEELPEFAPSLPMLGKFSPAEIRETLGRIFLLSDVVIIPTADETAKVPAIFKERGLTVAIFVSNFDHISRIAQLVGAQWKEMGVQGLTPTFRAAWSLYSGGSMQDVVVFEPPAVTALGSVDPRRLLKIRGNAKALAEVDAVLKRFGA